MVCTPTSVAMSDAAIDHDDGTTTIHEETKALFYHHHDASLFSLDFAISQCQCKHSANTSSSYYYTVTVFYYFSSFLVRGERVVFACYYFSSEIIRL
jgi:hypothetical protein